MSWLLRVGVFSLFCMSFVQSEPAKANFRDRLLDQRAEFYAQFKTWIGPYMCPHPDGRNEIIACGTPHTYRITPSPHGGYFINSYTPQNFRPIKVEGGNNRIYRNGGNGHQESFKIEPHRDSHTGNLVFALRSVSSGKYVAAEADGTFTASRDHASDWERFDIVTVSSTGHKINYSEDLSRDLVSRSREFHHATIKNAHGKYLFGMHGSGFLLLGGPVLSFSNVKYRWNLTISPLGGYFINLSPHVGKLYVDHGDRLIVKMNKGNGDWETFNFEVHPHSNASKTYYAIRSLSSGLYLAAEPQDGYLVANRPSLGLWERFEIEEQE